MRLFFTAGTQFPFPRLADAVVRVASRRPDWVLVYQAGPGEKLSTFAGIPNLEVYRLLDSTRFAHELHRADLVITHAGMGNVMTCLERGKPFVMFPRQARHAEHRNNHQCDSAISINELYGTPFFYEVDALVEAVVEQRVSLQVKDVSEALHRHRTAFGRELQRLIGDA